MSLLFRRQRGIALFSALLILIVIAVIGIAIGTGGSVMQKTVSAQQDLSVAASAAESTLVAAERAIRYNKLYRSEVVDPTSGATDIFVTDFDANSRWWEDSANWAAAGVVTMDATAPLFGVGKPLESVAPKFDAISLSDKTQFRVEVNMDPAGLRKLTAEEGATGLRLYQVTVRSSGRGTAEKTMQSVYGVMELSN